MPETDDFRCVQQCLNGDTSAFATLVDRYQTPLFNAALRITGNQHDAQDVVQGVFLKAFEKLDTFNPKFKFFSWIYRMTVNSAINLVNQRRPLQSLETESVAGDESPAEALGDLEVREKVEEALMRLQIDSRVVIVLRHFGEFSYREMSYILDIPEKTVKSRLFSARQLLKDILQTRGISADG